MPATYAKSSATAHDRRQVVGYVERDRLGAELQRRGLEVLEVLRA
jgi:hypothetical protein